MESIHVAIPISVSDTKLDECLSLLRKEVLNFKIRNDNSLLDRKLIIYIPEEYRTSKNLVKLGIIIGAYLK